MQKKYTIGLDFGTLSARATLVDVYNGEEKAVSVFGYQDAVITNYLPGTSIKVPKDYALQNPRDYIDALECLLKDVWRKAKISPDQVIGIGVDFTSCTMLPVNAKYEPLCFDERYRNNVQSWAKIWKHHGAKGEAEKINYIAKIRDESFLKRYGNKINLESMFPKILETLNNAPEVYNATYRFIEGCDWIVYLLTGKERRNSCVAGYKSIWNKKEGYPSPSFFKAIDPRMENVVEKLGKDVYTIGTKVGGITKEIAQKSGLIEGTAVGVGNTDAHLAVPALGVTDAGKLVLIMGTSVCHMIVSKKEAYIDGITGVVEDGILPGYFGYEAGQSAVGDIFDWFVSNLAPYDYIKEAYESDISIFDVMNKKAAKLKPGESGLLALDWLNGSRSILVDSDLSGVIVGLTLSTTPEEIYRALIEATAFGTRIIIESFVDAGIEVNEILACGGLSRKSKTVMKIFSDVLGKEIKISDFTQTSALGAAMYGAVAAGKEIGGYDTIFDAALKMSRIKKENFIPDMQNHLIYTSLFEQYKKLYDLFGRSNLDTMEKLKTIRNNAYSICDVDSKKNKSEFLSGEFPSIKF